MNKTNRRMMAMMPGGAWGEPEEVVSNYRGDPGIDAAGNLYFTHLFYDEDENMIEADIHVAYRNQGRLSGREGSGRCNAH